MEKANKLAYKLFSEPRVGKLKKEAIPKTLQSAVHETIKIGQDQIQTYIWKGNENIILLVHGWESNASRWKKMLPYLKKSGSTIIALDAPAHGLSSGIEFNVPKYAEFINEAVEKYNPKTIIAHSIGGAASAFYLHKYQNPIIEKIVLIGAPSEMKIIIENYVTLLSLNSKIGSFLKKQSEVKFNIKIDDFSVHKFSEKFYQKALIIHDIYDKVVMVNEGRKFAKSWKNTLYIETEGLGHSMHNDALYQKVMHFLFESD
jgi:pimeloyl-ACP methyl ester carboxylesterase